MRGRRAFSLGVALNVASLATITGVWPDAWAGAWTWQAVAAAAFVPVAAAAWMAARNEASCPMGRT